MGKTRPINPLVRTLAAMTAEKARHGSKAELRSGSESLSRLPTFGMIGPWRLGAGFCGSNSSEG